MSKFSRSVLTVIAVMVIVSHLFFGVFNLTEGEYLLGLAQLNVFWLLWYYSKQELGDSNA